MAKKFNIVYKAAKETAYGNQAAALTVAASLNNVVTFSPILGPNGSVDAGAASAEYNIQRVKRIKGAEVANATVLNTTNALAGLDGFSTLDWETVGVATGKLRSVGLKMGINEEFNIDSLGEAHAKGIADSVNIQAIERHEALIEEAYTASGASAGTLVYTAAKTDIFDALTDAADEIMLLSDDFKHMTSQENMVIIMHPTVAKMVAKEIGTVFNQEAPIYQTGFKSRMSINGIPVLVDANLNKFEDTDATKRVGAIVMDIEALAFKAANETEANVTQLGHVKFAGTYFYNITKAIDPTRIKHLVFDATGKAGKTAKASA